MKALQVSQLLWLITPNSLLCTDIANRPNVPQPQPQYHPDTSVHTLDDSGDEEEKLALIHD